MAILHPRLQWSDLQPPRGQHRRNLVFPNNELSRQWALEATKDKWIAIVDVFLLTQTTSPNASLCINVVRSRLRLG